MPARNVVKEYVEDSYYHVYNRGVSKEKIFLDEEDYTVFLGLLKRYLGQKPLKQKNRVSYISLDSDVKLLAYCLMPNHFHLLLFQHTKAGMKELLKRVSVSYGMYFNKKYKRTGAVFQQCYRAVRIDSDAQLAHISRYVHMNPQDYKQWQWSSLQYYVTDRKAVWLTTTFLPDVRDYMAFLDEYRSRRDELAMLKEDLADNC